MEPAPIPAPIIVTAQMGKADQAWANKLRTAHFPPERNFLDAHITLFHHLPPSMLPEVKARLAAVCSETPPPASQLTDIMNLGRGTAFRLNSLALLAIRDALAQQFAGVLTPQDQARPRLHITVQNKVDPAAARALQQQLSQQFEPRAFSVTGLSAYYYRGGPWEPIQSWVFRG